MGTSKLNACSTASLAKSLDKRKKIAASKINAFNFDILVRKLHNIAETLPDSRIGRNISKNLKDAFLCAFSVFFTQSPSFLSHQKSMQEKNGKNNASTLFGIKDILSDSHIRRLLDVVPPSHIYPLFETILEGLNGQGYLSRFRSYGNNLLVALDGTGYFFSHTIHCANCSQKRQSDGSISYSHSAVTPVVVKPGNNKVISLTPEYITPQDGHDKQDCENAAAKRWLKANGPTLKQLGVTIAGDDLYCNHPMCELILSEGLDFIIICKEDSHPTLYEYVRFLAEDIQTVVVTRWKGKQQVKDTYRFLNGVPLRDKDSLEVNWCEITTTLVGEEDGARESKPRYKNSFATNFNISQENVIEIVADGRARWKIENENNNVLKTKGYHLEHNFGHGKKHLSSLLMTLNLLAYLFHTVLDLSDESYGLIRRKLPTRKTFFQDIRALTRYMCFDNWNKLMLFMMRGLKLEIPNIGKDSDTNDTS